MPAVDPPGVWTLGFLGALGLSMAWVLLRSLAVRPQRSGDYPPPQGARSPQFAAPAGPPAGFSEEALRATTRELAARLDSKIRLLESLLRDAERAAGRLEAVLAAAARYPNMPSAGDAAASQATAPVHCPRPTHPPSSPPSLPARLPGQAEGLKDATVLATLRPPGESLPGESLPPGAHEHHPRSPRYEAVDGLAQRGYPAEEIARRTGIPLGEVQLVLNLRRVEMPAGTF